jgi:hypothetical protein
MKFPKMKCDKCGKCCSVVFCSNNEFKIIQKFVAKNNIIPIKQGMICPFFIDNSCAVYSIRPYLCKLFGHTHQLQCCNGYNKNISIGQVERLNEQFLPKQNASCLHEICFTKQEIESIVTQEINNCASMLSKS